MQRGLIVGFLVCSLALFEVQATKEATLGSRVVADANPSVQWENVDGMQVAKLWLLEGPSTWPQVTIVRVSNATYLQFSQDPQSFVDFVNKQKFFSKPVIEAGPWVTLSSVEQTQPTTWVLTLMHGKRSTLIVSALPQLMMEASKTKP
jgi:hypothetical protein